MSMANLPPGGHLGPRCPVMLGRLQSSGRKAVIIHAVAHPG